MDACEAVITATTEAFEEFAEEFAESDYGDRVVRAIALLVGDLRALQWRARHTKGDR